MSFRYENYGTADLLTVEGTTVITSNSKYGTAFYQTTRAACFGIPSCQELWIKADIHTTTNYNRDSKSQCIRFFNGGSAGACGFSTGISGIHTLGMLQTFYNGTSQSSGTNRNSSFVSNRSYSILLHMKTGTSDGLVEWQLSDGRSDSYNGNVNNGSHFDDIFIQGDSDTVLISNVIISDEEISLNDNARMPFSLINDIQRELVPYSLFSLSADTHRVVTANFSSQNDTNRRLGASFSIANDTVRKLATPFYLEIDTDRVLATSFYLKLDTHREIFTTFNLPCDTLKKIPHMILLDAII